MVDVKSLCKINLGVFYLNILWDPRDNAPSIIAQNTHCTRVFYDYITLVSRQQPNK